MMLVARTSLRLVPLTGALLLHALLLAGAATVGFRVANRDEDTGTITLALLPPYERPEAVFVPEIAPDPAPVLEPVLPDATLEEPGLVESELWSRLPAEETIAARDELPSAIDLSRFDRLAHDIGDLGGELGRERPGAAGPAASGTSTAGVAGVGSGGGGVATGRGSGGTGLAGPAVASLAGAPRAPVIREPAPLDVPAPAYPRLSRRAGEEGSVLCRLQLSEQGLVTRVEVLESSGFARLDDAAREALARWRFEPRLVDGRAVASTLQHRVTFRLDG